MSDNIGKIIQQLRGRRGWTQYDLASKISKDLHQGSVSNWERGGDAVGGPWYYFDQLCKVFEYPPELLVCWADRELTKIEKTAVKVQEFKAELAARKQPRTAVNRLDELISQNRKMLADLEELRRELSGEPGAAA